MPKGSKTAIVRGTRAVLLDARRDASRVKYALWKDAVAHAAELAARHVLSEPLDGPIAIAVVFYLRRPKHETRVQRTRQMHTSRPDLDKLVRAVLDPLSGVLIADDARISSLRAEKRFAEEAGDTRAEITVTRLLTSA